MNAERQRNQVAELQAELRAKLDAAQSRIAELERFSKHIGDGAKARTAKVANLRRALRQFMRAKEAHVAEMLAELGDRRRLLQEVGRTRKQVVELEQTRGKHQQAIRDLIGALRIACPDGNAWVDCYDIPTFTGQG